MPEDELIKELKSCHESIIVFPTECTSGQSQMLTTYDGGYYECSRIAHADASELSFSGRKSENSTHEGGEPDGKEGCQVHEQKE